MSGYDGTAPAKVGDVATGPGWELRCGDYREVLADVEPDAVITDPPYSPKTHRGHNTGTAAVNRVRPSDERRMRVDKRTGAVYAVGKHRRRTIDYARWSKEDVEAFVGRWGSVNGWIVALSSDDMRPWYRDAFESAGRYAHHQLPCCIRGMTVRMCGDGPASWAVYAQPSRPRWAQHWGALPGFYAGGAEPLAVVGGKPMWLMRALVRDYSRPGDLVCDPCAGGATTLLAAVLEGRRAIGSELDPATFRKAVKRLRSHAITPPLPGMEPAPKMRQDALCFDDESEAAE